MNYVERQVAIIKPKEPYLEWINAVSEPGDHVRLEDLQTDCTAILLPHFDTVEESMNYLEQIFHPIFECELLGWSNDRNAWPNDRTLRLFHEWFAIEFHSEVIDAENGPIAKIEHAIG